MLINFFRAARLRDNTTLANIASVAFDPRTDGTVQNFTIAKIGGERRTKLTSERATAVGSLTPPGQPDVDLSKMDVDVISEDVTVKADVHTPDGRTLPKTLVFTLQRAVGTEDGQARSGRWIIIGVVPRT